MSSGTFASERNLVESLWLLREFVTAITIKDIRPVMLQLSDECVKKEVPIIIGSNKRAGHKKKHLMLYKNLKINNSHMSYINCGI